MLASALQIKGRAMTPRQIIKYYGGRTKAAGVLGFTLQTFRNWERGGIPLRSQQVIQYLSGGALKVSKK